MEGLHLRRAYYLRGPDAGPFLNKAPGCLCKVTIPMTDMLLAHVSSRCQPHLEDRTGRRGMTKATLAAP